MYLSRSSQECISINDDAETSILLETDLLRGAERFDDTLNFIERNKSMVENEIPNKILIFQKALCLQKDNGCHEILAKGLERGNICFTMTLLRVFNFIWEIPV